MLRDELIYLARAAPTKRRFNFPFNRSHFNRSTSYISYRVLPYSLSIYCTSYSTKVEKVIKDKKRLSKLSILS